MLGILWHILTIRAMPYTARNCSHILRPRNANSSACLVVKYPMSWALNTGRCCGHCWPCIVTPRRIEKYRKYQWIAILLDFKMDVPFLQRKQNKYQWPFQFKHLNCRYLPPKYGLIWYGTSKKTKNICFLDGYGISWYIPPWYSLSSTSIQTSSLPIPSPWSFLAPGAGKELVWGKSLRKWLVNVWDDR